MMSAGKGKEGRTWSSCAVKQLQFYHKLTGSVRWWRWQRRERDGSTTVWYHRGCRGGGGVVMGCVEEGEENITCIPSHFTCISHSENGVQTTMAYSTHIHTCCTLQWLQCLLFWLLCKVT